MSAGAWTFYNAARKHLGAAAINLSTGNFRMSLYASASNAATLTLSTIGSVTSETTEANGYFSSGKALSGKVWTAGASAKQMKFDSTAVSWTASGASITWIKYAVLWASGASAGARKLVCYSQLSSAQFQIASGSSLVVTPAASGIFTLV